MRTAPLVALSSLLLPTVARAVPGIPDVRSLTDLRAVQAVATDAGYHVRVGLADPGPDAGPFKLIYCLATPRAGPTTRSTGDPGRYPLGPLTVDVIDPSANPSRQSLSMSENHPGEWLTAQSLPVNGFNGLTVRVYAGPAVILEQPLGRVDRRKLYWSTFAAQPSHAPQVVVNPAPWPACPASDGYSSLLRSLPTTRPTTAPVPPADDPLPGVDPSPAWRHFYCPAAPAELLTLSLDGDHFRLAPHGPLLVAPYADHLLARWWVNGRPAEVPQTPRAVGKQWDTMLKPPRDGPIDVAFGLPPMLGPMKAGDVVGLQLMWVDHAAPVASGGLLAMQAMLARVQQIGLIPVPAPSNRLDVTLTDALLSAAGR